MNDSKTLGLLANELEALRRARDQAATQIVTAKNCLDAGLLTLTDVSSRIQRIEACLDALQDQATVERGQRDEKGN